MSLISEKFLAANISGGINEKLHSQVLYLTEYKCTCGEIAYICRYKNQNNTIDKIRKTMESKGWHLNKTGYICNECFKKLKRK